MSEDLDSIVEEAWYLKGLISDAVPSYGNNALTEMVSRIREIEADDVDELQKKILGYLKEESQYKARKKTHKILVKVSSKIAERLLKEDEE